MRHLRVPSRETAAWLTKLSNLGWLEQGYSIVNLNTHRGIPLSALAPNKIEGLEQIEIERENPRPKHWLELIPLDIRQTFEDFWPMSHDELGDILILKIPEEINHLEQMVADAILTLNPSIRLVCADEGVKGEYRVRDLRPIKSRNDDFSTRTRVRENGKQFWIDPAKAYYSPRLATERLNTLVQARELRSRLGRPIRVIDPYAGIGPALPILFEDGLVEWAHASDINPEAVKLLKENLPEVESAIYNALELPSDLHGKADLLLINLPHSSIDHLEQLLPLLAKGEEVMVRGWAIMANEEVKNTQKRIVEIFNQCEVLEIELKKTRSYSPSDAFCVFQISCIIPKVKD